MKVLSRILAVLFVLIVFIAGYEFFAFNPGGDSDPSSPPDVSISDAGVPLAPFPNTATISEDAYNTVSARYIHFPLTAGIDAEAFTATLQSLYEAGYVLVDIRDTFALTDTGETVAPALPVPEGKTPLILGFDEQTDGVTHDKLEVEEGSPVELLDRFIDENPDFATCDARAVIAVGLHNYDFFAQTAADMQNRGYAFACLGIPDMTRPEQFAADAERWRNEIGGAVGESAIYIFRSSVTAELMPETARELVLRGFRMLYLDETSAFHPTVLGEYIVGTRERGELDTTASVTDREPAPEDESESESKPETAPEPQRKVTLAVGGDVLPDGQIGNKIKAGDFAGILDTKLAERFRDADISLVNLETSVSTRGTPIPEKQYTFRAPPENLTLLTDWLGADVVTLANNHTPDYGWDALTDTVDNVRAVGVATVGAGRNLKEALEPYIAEVGGQRVAIFGASQILSYLDWPATDSKPGLLIAREPTNLGAFGTAIKSARESCDYVIVYMHWGVELDSKPNQRQTSFAHALIDAGVDAVIGAHAHVVQTFEYYKGKPIAYSLGNFLFNSQKPETVAAFLELENGAVKLSVVPCRISGTLTAPAAANAAATMLADWNANNVNCAFDINGVLQQK
ncbi:MAG: CapA family protein [Oscillospiraceae bacterium]|nr:CapA family protein [Oscillospiraceae bacterium]